MMDLAREQLLHAEVLGEFAARQHDVQEFFGFSIERPVGRRRKKREANVWLDAVLKAKRHEERRRRAAVPCPGCGKNVRSQPGKTGPYPKWCSSRCYHREYQRALRKSCGLDYRRTCPARGCGKSFEIPLWKRGQRAVYCSERCANRERCRRHYHRRQAREGRRS